MNKIDVVDPERREQDDIDTSNYYRVPASQHDCEFRALVKETTILMEQQRQVLQYIASTNKQINRIRKLARRGSDVRQRVSRENERIHVPAQAPSPVTTTQPAIISTGFSSESSSDEETSDELPWTGSSDEPWLRKKNPGLHVNHHTESSVNL